MLCILAVFVNIAAAQNKLLTVDDIFSPDPKVRVRFGGTPMMTQWTRDGKALRQMQNGKMMRVDPVSAQASEIYDTKKLADALVNAGVSAENAGRVAASPVQNFNSADSAILLNVQNDLWFFDIQGVAARPITRSPNQEEKEADFSPDGKWVSFVRGYNLFVVNVAAGAEKQLTRDGSATIYNGYLDWVYEEELYGRGQNRGYWWSPDSKSIAFLRFDESKVPKFVLPDDTVADQRIENTEYPKAGDSNPLVKLATIQIETPRPAVRFIDLKKYKPEDLLIARVAWTPDSKNIVFQALNREQTYLDVNAASPGGVTQTLLTEKTDAWVDVFGNPTFLADGRAVWESARDGWKHLYFYDRSCKLIRRLTEGEWEVRTFYGVDKAGEWAYFSATKDSHIEENIYRVKLDGTSGVKKLSDGRGWHAANFDPTFTYFTDTWSDVNTPSQVRLYKSDGTFIKVLHENKVAALGEYRLSKPEFMKINTRDGFEMEAVIIKPPDFDPTKKYPVLIFTYAGVHSPVVANRFSATRNMWFQMLAQKGYIIWMCDNRTASGKGHKSAWLAYKNLGELELKDIEDGISYLRSTGYVDPGRIGMWGWSNGGFMTAYAMIHSKSFKMGIAGGTVSDWRLYDSIFTERVMLTPQNNPEGYEKSSVLKAAGNLHGRLLLVHGAMDNNVHPQHTTWLAYELQKANKQFDMMIYPTQRHGITDPAQNYHYYNMITEYVLKNL